MTSILQLFQVISREIQGDSCARLKTALDVYFRWVKAAKMLCYSVLREITQVESCKYNTATPGGFCGMYDMTRA